MNMSYFDKTYHIPGTPPGTLIGNEEASGRFRLIDFTDKNFTDITVQDIEECRPFLNTDSITWIHIQGQIQPEIIKNLGLLFDLHPLALEDILNKGQRPKVEEFENLLFVIMAMPVDTDGTNHVEQVSVFLGQKYLISFHGGSEDPFEPLRERLRKKVGRIRQLSADYLLYCILDIVIDHGYPVLERISEEIEAVEDQLLSTNVDNNTLAQIHLIRRELLLLRKSLWPQRDVLNVLLRNETTLINESTHIYLRDCYDHTIQIFDMVENYREMANSLIDVYLSSVSHRLNDIMRLLTVIATIFIPLTFVVGVYGMNFSHENSPWAMPELHWYYGYPMVWGIMIGLVLLMIYYFKRKNLF